MKFSSSSSSSVSSTATVDGNSGSAAAGCIAGVLRRLLCFNSFPTYPSDNVREPGESTEFDGLESVKTEEEKVQSSATPGIVARLMGLEYMPPVDFSGTQTSPSSISRSRSMNSVDSLRELKSIQGRHRRVKSFREAPASFLELEDDKFFILSFESGDETKKSNRKTRKSEVGFTEPNPRRRESVYEKNIENQDSNEDSQTAMEELKLFEPKINKDNTRTRRRRRRRRIKKMEENSSPIDKEETDCDSQKSSPVSVLDLGEFPTSPEVQFTEEDSRLACSNSRRTLLGELENHNQPKLCNENRQRIERRCRGLKKKCDLGGEMCKLVEKEVAECKWVCREVKRVDDFGGLDHDLGASILDQLLLEIVDELLSNFTT